MDTKDLLLGLVVFGLLASTIIFAVRSSTNETRVEDAKEMSATLVASLQEQKYPLLYKSCRGISAGEYQQISACLTEASTTKDLSKLFREDKFQNYDEKLQKPGFLVVENFQGTSTFASANFTLSFNNEVVAHGCAAQGEIAPGYVCRFELERLCSPGDNLEVKYNEKRAYLKTC